MFQKTSKYTKCLGLLRLKSNQCPGSFEAGDLPVSPEKSEASLTGGGELVADESPLPRMGLNKGQQRGR